MRLRMTAKRERAQIFHWILDENLIELKDKSVCVRACVRQQSIERGDICRPHCVWVSCEWTRTTARMLAPWFDAIQLCRSWCGARARTTQQGSERRKGSEFSTKHWPPHHCHHYHHGGRSSPTVLMCHVRHFFFLPFLLVFAVVVVVVPFLYQDYPKCLILSVRPEQRDKSQVKWTVLLTMKFESVGIWHSHMSAQHSTASSSRHHQRRLEGRRKKILIVKIWSLMHRPPHTVCRSVFERGWMAYSSPSSAALPPPHGFVSCSRRSSVEVFLFYLFFYTKIVGKAIQRECYDAISRFETRNICCRCSSWRWCWSAESQYNIISSSRFNGINH